MQSPAVLAEVVQQSPRQNNYTTKTKQPRSGKNPSNSGVRRAKIDAYVIKYGERGTFPDGSTLEPDGTITTPDGFKFQMIIRNKAMVGLQFFRSNGEKLKPGETLELRNGKVVRQQGL